MSGVGAIRYACEAIHQVRSSRQPRLLVVVSASRMLLLLALLLRLLRLPSQLAMQAGAGAV